MSTRRRAARPETAARWRHRVPAPRHSARPATRPVDTGPSHPPPASARGRQRRLRRRILSGAAVTMLGLGVMIAPTALMPGWNSPDALRPTGVPADNPRLGLVYQGLALATDGAPCVGAFQLTDPGLCSPGPDHPPPGLDVSRDVSPTARVEAAPALPRRDTSTPPLERDVLADAGASAPADDLPALVPVVAGTSAGTSAGIELATAANGVVCDGDGHSGNRIHLLYVYEADTVSRLRQYLASFRELAAGVDAIFDASARQTGGSRHPRYVTTAGCAVDVREVQLPVRTLATFTGTIAALKTLGFDRVDRKYMIFADANVYCGIGTFARDDSAGPDNHNNRGPSYGRTDAGCWTASVAAHELAHNLGAVQDSAPNAATAGHCADEHDLMCHDDRPTAKSAAACPDRVMRHRLDCGHDDYFHTNPALGSYLATHWNVANSAFLLAGPADRAGDGSADSSAADSSADDSAADSGGTRGGADEPSDDAAARPIDGGGDTGTPTPDAGTRAPGSVRPPALPGPSEAALSDTVVDGAAVPRLPKTPAPGPGLTPGPDPDVVAPSGPTASSPATSGARGLPGPTAGAAPQPPRPPSPGVLRVTATTATSTRLGWAATTPGAAYTVVVDGRPLGTTTATAVQVIGLRPGHSYQARISVRGADGTLRAHSQTETVRTRTANLPRDGRWFSLGNALVPAAASVYGARVADGTPLVLAPADGAADQQWRLRDLGRGRYLIRSRATGKCAVPMGTAVPGAVVIQKTCETADVAQHWRVLRDSYGFTLVTVESALAIGVSRLRYGNQRLLVLQRPDSARYQSWLA